MIVYFSIGLIVILLGLHSKSNNNDYGLFGAFTLIFFFLALRYNYGTDYIGYLNLFTDIQINYELYIGGSYRIEPGWAVLNKLFYPLGFFSLVILLAFFNCFVYYNFIQKYVERKYYWLALLIYFFNSNFLLIHLSAMRQSLAIALFLFSLDYLILKKYLIFSAIILLAFSIHTSALFLFPVVIIVLLFSFKIKILHILFLEILFISLFIFGNIFKSHFYGIVILLFSSQYSQYEILEFSNPSLINALVYSLLLFILLINYNKFPENYHFLIKLFTLGIFLLPIGYIIPMASRLGWYFLPFSLIIYPKILEILPSKWSKDIFVFCIIGVFSMRLFTFFSSEVYFPHYSKYSTIFNTLF
jgi:hypothetical protein